MPREQQVEVFGTVAPGFEEVRNTFIRNFSNGSEIGASCAAYCQGSLVVNLWGGIRDEGTGAPWEEDTMALVSSTTKGLTSMAVALAHSEDCLNWINR